MATVVKGEFVRSIAAKVNNADWQTLYRHSRRCNISLSELVRSTLIELAASLRTLESDEDKEEFHPTRKKPATPATPHKLKLSQGRKSLLDD